MEWAALLAGDGRGDDRGGVRRNCQCVTPVLRRRGRPPRGFNIMTFFIFEVEECVRSAGPSRSTGLWSITRQNALVLRVFNTGSF